MKKLLIKKLDPRFFDFFAVFPAFSWNCIVFRRVFLVFASISLPELKNIQALVNAYILLTQQFELTVGAPCTYGSAV